MSNINYDKTPKHGSNGFDIFSVRMPSGSPAQQTSVEKEQQVKSQLELNINVKKGNVPSKVRATY